MDSMDSMDYSLIKPITSCNNYIIYGFNPLIDPLNKELLMFEGTYRVLTPRLTYLRESLNFHSRILRPITGTIDYQLLALTKLN